MSDTQHSCVIIGIAGASASGKSLIAQTIYEELVAELGAIVEDHLKSIGMLHDPEMSPEQRALIAEKRRAYEDRSKKNSDVADLFPEPKVAEAPRSEDVAVTGEGASFPPSATMCHKCSQKAVVIMDGCATCLNCGYSKCG